MLPDITLENKFIHKNILQSKRLDSKLGKKVQLNAAAVDYGYKSGNKYICQDFLQRKARFQQKFKNLNSLVCLINVFHLTFLDYVYCFLISINKLTN